MTIYERVELYKSLYQGSTAPTIVSKIIADGFYTLTGLEALEAIRRLNTDLSDYYQVSIPVITVWVRMIIMYRLQERYILQSRIWRAFYINSGITSRT